MTTIEYVTHASLLFRKGTLTLLTDPFYWFDPLAATVMLHFPPRELHPSQFGSIRFLYSSHVHPDHSHPATLAALKSHIETVLLPAERPGLWQRYRDLGFTDIRVLDHGQTLDLGDGVAVTSYWSDPVDTCLVVDLGDTVALHLNDCLPTLELTRRIAARHRIDYAFMLYTSAQDLFPFLLPHPEADRQALARHREKAFLAQQLERLAELRPRVVVPYSMTMTYFQPEQRHLNGYHRLTPPQFARAVHHARPDCRTIIVEPGDVLDVAPGTLQTVSPTHFWGDTLDSYLHNVREFADSQAFLPRFKQGTVGAIREPLRRHLEGLIERPPPPALAELHQFLRRGIRLVVTGDDGAEDFFVDLLQRRVTVGSRQGVPVLDMTVPASIVQAMLEGHYDPYSLLFLHRIQFQVRSLVRLEPEVESSLYIMSFLLLLCDNPLDFISQDHTELPSP